MQLGYLLTPLTIAFQCLGLLCGNCEGKQEEVFRASGGSSQSARLPSIIPLDRLVPGQSNANPAHVADLTVQTIPIVKHAPKELMGLDPRPESSGDDDILREEDENLLMLVDSNSRRQCQLIEQPVCQGLLYTHTLLPNSVGLTVQSEAGKRMQDYHSLINVGCSEYLRFFLCTVYFPMCSSTPSPPTSLLPCRPFCQHVQRQCEPIMQRFSFLWPSELSCDRLPLDSDMCIQPRNYNLDRRQQADGNQEAWLPRQVNPETLNVSESVQQVSSFIGAQEVFNGPACNTPLWLDDLGVVRRHVCAVHCQADLFYRPEAKEFATLWMAICSMVTVLNALITLVTLLGNPSRFAYPHRSVVYLSICYLGYAGGHLLRVLLGRQRAGCYSHRVAEVGLGEATPRADEFFQIRIGHETVWCVVVFILTFYFQQASHLWWLITGITWYLSAARHWAHEGILGLGTIFQLVAWAVPAILTVLAVLLHRIEADELTGICVVGGGSGEVLSSVLLVLVPQTTCLILGSIFQAIGFTAISSMRRSMLSAARRFPARSSVNSVETIHLRPINGRPDRRPATERRNPIAWDFRRLDKLFIKMTILCLLYILPSVCVLGVDLFKTVNQATWLKSLSQLVNHRDCLSPEKGVHWRSCPLLLEETGRQRLNSGQGSNWTHVGSRFPSVEASMVQLFMSLVTGTTTSLWLWCNRKTWLCCISKTTGYCRKTSLGLSRRVRDVDKMEENRDGSCESVEDGFTRS